MANPKAREAMDKEYRKLELAPWSDKKGHGCWDLSRVASERAVREHARTGGAVQGESGIEIEARTALCDHPDAAGCGSGHSGRGANPSTVFEPMR